MLIEKGLLCILRVLYFSIEVLFEIFVYFRRNLWKYENQDIINSVVHDETYVASQSNKYAPVVASHLKKKTHLYRITLQNGLSLDCADEHMISVSFGYCKFVKDLKKGDPINTALGVSKVKSIEKLKSASHVFDITVASQDKLYYTDDILSHNSITSGIFIVWYLLFNKDRNVMCVSENGDKVQELVDKIDTIMRELPFYMKLGMVTNNMFTKVYDNGCKLKAQRTTENTGASFTIHLLYADEFALINERFLKDFYRTIYPTLTSSEISRMIITSTPRGMNKFYDIYQGALDSENEFNPIRVDWYEVPLNDKKGDPLLDKDGNIVYRGEEWKKKTIANLGSEDDFNQEFGNQFLAGNKLLYNSVVLRKLKKLQVSFVHKDIEQLDDLDLAYEGVLTWHPKFDIDNLSNATCRYVVSIDLGDGGGGDYSVMNIFQILPMSKFEITNLKIFGDDKDFFKLVQVGLLRSNHIPITEFAKLTYHICVDVINHENVKCVLEMNHEGNYFKEQVISANGQEGEVEEEHFFVKFKYNMGDENSEVFRTGINMNDPTKELACKILKDKVKYSQLIPTEKVTVDENISYSRNKKGKFEGQGRNDDCVCTCRNLSLYFSTTDFLDQIEELLEFVPQEFHKLVDEKLNRQSSREDDSADLYM